MAFILFRLLGASEPVPTDIFISSESPSLISVHALQVEGKNMLPDGWSPSSVAGSAGPATKPQATAGLRIGRPTTIQAILAVPATAVAACTLEPCPHGACLVRVKFLNTTDLRCNFECDKTASAKAGP